MGEENHWPGLSTFVGGTMKPRIATVLVATAAFVLCACQGPDVSNPDPGDTSAPSLTFASVGLQHDVVVAPGGVAALRLRATDGIQLLSQATDDNSGINEVSIRGRLEVICNPHSGANKIVITEAVDQTTTRKDGSSHPSSLTAAFPLSGADQRSKCPAGSSFRELTGSLTASASNTAGLVSQLGPLSIRSFGPDIIKVATFNLYRPGHHADSVYVTWGQYLRDKADVILLTEVEDLRRAELLANAAEMENVVQYRDVAIASRGPISNVYRYTVDPPFSRLESADSKLMVAETNLGNYPHQVAVAHFGIRDAGDKLFEPWRSAPGRLEAAHRIIDEIETRNSADPPIVGGDFNAYSGLGPQDHPGATDEVTTLRNRFTDPITVLNVPDADLCGGHHIDYILANGYAPTSYKNDCSASSPSDHPMVLAVMEAN
jgi:endonuclease/exonuclease/phosphatase (EEP) superfamily protein YafD